MGVVEGRRGGGEGGRVVVVHQLVVRGYPWPFLDMFVRFVAEGSGVSM